MFNCLNVFVICLIKDEFKVDYLLQDIYKSN